MYNVTENSTQHGFSTPHGHRTPHRFPSRSATFTDILALTNQLYPTGRAFRLPVGGVFENSFSSALGRDRGI